MTVGQRGKSAVKVTRGMVHNNVNYTRRRGRVQAADASYGGKMDSQPGPSLFDRLVARALKTRWLMRAPIALYRGGLGFLLGRRLMMVEHRGRSSGRRRFVVIECIDRTTPGVYLAASGFGTVAQWYRNIAANGVAYVSSGTRRRIPTTARLLTKEESLAALEAYAARYPDAWRHLSAAMDAAAGGKADIRIVEFTAEGGERAVE